MSSMKDMTLTYVLKGGTVWSKTTKKLEHKTLNWSGFPTQFIITYIMRLKYIIFCLLIRSHDSNVSD